MRTICAIVLCVLFYGCVNNSEPEITPPTPVFTPATTLLDTLDHRIYADVDPTTNAIVLEWLADTTNNTSGYVIYRSPDSLLDPQGLLANRITVATIESSNLLIDPLPTSFRDTTNVQVRATYWYQMQAFHRSPTNSVNYSAPTHVDITTSFHYETRVNLLNPDGAVSLPPSGVVFSWQDPETGGSYQIIVQRTDQEQYVWSGQLSDFQSLITTEYPSTAVPLVVGGVYRWRVKRIDLYGGSSSAWKTFNVTS